MNGTTQDQPKGLSDAGYRCNCGAAATQIVESKDAYVGNDGALQPFRGDYRYGMPLSQTQCVDHAEKLVQQLREAGFDAGVRRIVVHVVRATERPAVEHPLNA